MVFENIFLQSATKENEKTKWLLQGFMGLTNDYTLFDFFKNWVIVDVFKFSHSFEKTYGGGFFKLKTRPTVLLKKGFFLYKPSERLLLSLRWKGFLTKPLTWMLLHCAFYSINQFILLSLFKEFDKINGVRKWITLNLGEWIYVFFQVCRKVHSFWDAFLQRNSKGEEM